MNKIKKFRLRLTTRKVLLVLLGIGLLFTVAETTAGETDSKTLVVTPAIASLGSTVQILGAGFTPGTKIYIYIAPEPIFGWDAPTKTQAMMLRLKPEPMPVVNVGGAFSTSFKTRGIRKAGVYSVEARTKQGQILATAPLKLSK
jgi:hypothetical protein